MPDKIIRNLKLTLEYDGTNYCGWQTQNRHKPAIQEIIEKALRKILQEKVRVIGSGRTDAGVHALAQVANFKTKSRIPAHNLQRALNSLLPADISVTKIEEAGLDFHSRFSAKSKIYRYTILNAPVRSAFLEDKVYFYPCPLDVRLMQQEAKCLLGRHDFKSFCASGSSSKDTFRTIKRVAIKKATHNLQPITYNLTDTSLIFIEIESDGFLYNMVRNLAGTLIEIGRGRFPKGNLRKILLSGDRKLAGPAAPAKGLCLMAVKY